MVDQRIFSFFHVFIGEIKSLQVQLAASVVLMGAVGLVLEKNDKRLKRQHILIFKRDAPGDD